jgi:hypothetical protein
MENDSIPMKRVNSNSLERQLFDETAQIINKRSKQRRKISFLEDDCIDYEGDDKQ